MDSRLTTVLLFVLLILGIGILLYPIVSDYYNSFHLSRASASYVKQMENMDDELYESSYYEKLPSDIIPLAPEFMRGRSFDDCIIMLDEAQNMDLDELQTMVTRIGNMCKMAIIGSPNQIDVPGQTPEKNAFDTAYEILKPTGLVGYVELSRPMRTSFVVDFDLRFLEYKLKHKNDKK